MGAWIRDNWFTLLQTAGIIGGLLFTTASFRLDAKVRRIGNLITLTAHHRDIWTQLYRRPELARVLRDDVDLSSSPVTPEEGVFVRLLVHHLAVHFRAAEAGLLTLPEGLGLDIQTIFSLPIVQNVWKSVRSFQDRDFVRFVEAALERPRSPAA